MLESISGNHTASLLCQCPAGRTDRDLAQAAGLITVQCSAAGKSQLVSAYCRDGVRKLRRAGEEFNWTRTTGIDRDGYRLRIRGRHGHGFGKTRPVIRRAQADLNVQCKGRKI